MIFKRFCYFILIVMISTYLISCDTVKTHKDTAGQAMEFLTSDKCDGRLTGTNGNKEAEKYIENYFEEIGLDKYNGSYKFEYTSKQLIPKGEDYELTFTFPNGEILKCKYGEDFFINSVTNLEAKYKLTFNENDKEISNSVIAGDIDKMNLKNLIGTSKGILIKTKSFKLMPAANNKNQTPIIQISEKLYKSIKDKGDAFVTIKFNVNGNEDKILQNNVVGVIPGEKHDNAVVISAHFDHVGSKTQKIWRGALDNASGTAVLLDVAKRVKEYSKKQKLKADIIICAFNGEELGLQGSEAFARDIKNRYRNLYNINIDCVGIQDGDELLISGENEASQKLADSLKENFEKRGLNIKNGNISSDHASFICNGISAVSIFQNGWDKIAHTLNDDLGKIDFKVLKNISNCIIDFLLSNSDKVYNSNKKSSNINIPAEEMELINAKSDLKYNEYKYTMVNGKNRIVHKNDTGFGGEDAIKEFNKIYPDVKIQRNLGNYQLDGFYVSDKSKKYVDKPVFGQIYTIRSLPENINSLRLFYKRKSETNLEQKEVYISFQIVNKSDYNEEEYIKGYAYSNMSVDKNGMDVNGEKYNVIYNNKDKSIRGMYRIVKKGEKICRIEISAPYKKEWEFKTKEAIKKGYKDLKLKALISEILKGLKI